jgi:pilus assembly protein FimV
VLRTPRQRARSIAKACGLGRQRHGHVALPVGARSRSAARRGAKQLSRFAPAARRAAAQAGLMAGASRTMAAAAGAAAHGLTAAPGNQAALDGRPSADAAVASSGARQPRWALRAEGAADRAAAPAAAPQPPWRTGAAAAAPACATAGCAALAGPALADALLARGWEPGGHMQGAAVPAHMDPRGAPAADAPLPRGPGGKENAVPLPLMARGPAGAPRAGAQACERGPAAARAEVRALAARLLALRRRDDPGPGGCHGPGGARRAPADATPARLPAAGPAAALAGPPAGARAGAVGAGSLPSAGRAAAEARPAGAGCPVSCSGGGGAALATRACEQQRPSGAAGGALHAVAAHAAVPALDPAKRCSGQGSSGGGASAGVSRDSSISEECGGAPSTERSSTSEAHDGGAVGRRGGGTTAARGAPSAACAASAAREDSDGAGARQSVPVAACESGAGRQCCGGSHACGEAERNCQGGAAVGAADGACAGGSVFAGVRAALDPRLPVDHVVMCAPAPWTPARPALPQHAHARCESSVLW